MPGKSGKPKPTKKPTKYREASSIRIWLKKQALHKGTVRRKNQSDPRIAPYMHFFFCVGDQETTMRKIFSIIRTAERDKKRAVAALAAKSGLSTDLNEIFEESRLESEIVAQEEIQDIFAGTLFVMLNNSLTSMAHRVHARGGSKPPTSAGRKIGRTTLFELITAAGNNFRHYEQWHGVISKDKRLAKNVAVLKAAGLRPPWNRNMCHDIFLLAGWKNEKVASLEIRKLASEIFQAQTGIPL